MKIDKTLSSNVVISKNGLGEEVVHMGKGLASQRKIRDEVSPETIQKEFVLRDSFTRNQFQQPMADIPAEETEWVRQVVELAEDKPKVGSPPNIYLILTDHPHHAITRAEENIQLPNPLLFETKKFYSREYQAAKEALLFVKQKTGVELSEGEAGFIAFRLVNSQQGSEDMRVTMIATIVVKGMLSVIDKFFGIVFDREFLNYRRIITHLQSFAQRYLKEEGSNG